MDLRQGVALCLAPGARAALAPEGSLSPAGFLVSPCLSPQLLDQELQYELLAHHPVTHPLRYRGKGVGTEAGGPGL